MSQLKTNFIVLDLEWNGHPDGKAAHNEVMPFEIIEIGAVKLNSDLERIDEFQAYIRPTVYPKLHYKTRELLGITYRDLKQARPFPEVIEDFFTWCGHGYRFCTWGSMDLTEIQRNLSYYGITRYFAKPVLYYNLQQIFSLQFDEASARTLQYALDLLSITQTRPFHDALDDAKYTAEVMTKLDPQLILKNFSIDYYRHPLSRSEEITLNYEDSSEFISREFHKKEELLRSHNVITLTCPLCGGKLHHQIRWYAGNVKNYYCLCRCPKHGFVQGKLHIKRTPDMHYFVIKTARVVSDEEAEQILTKYLSQNKPQELPVQVWQRKAIFPRKGALSLFPASPKKKISRKVSWKGLNLRGNSRKS